MLTLLCYSLPAIPGAGEMEEAYNELYQQFLRLRSLCLKQAALLHQLTTALQKQQGASIPNGEFSNVMSVPVQFTDEIPAYLLENPQTLTSVTQIPAAQCGADYFSRNTKSFPDLLADDMSKLCVDVPSQRKESVKAENKFPLLLPLDSLGCHGASSNESRNSKQNHPAGDRTLHTIRMPVMDCCNLINDFQGGSGGAMLSDVALQSHICEFCQAVFPGHTTTRGEFLRHLNTHVT